MKTIKSILVAATLIVASAVSTMSAQQANQPAYQFHVAIGDSVMIKPECTKYLTGERPSSWVWDKVHTVRQLGTKRDPNKYPNGVLLMNIYSWVCDTCLYVVNGHAAQAAAEATEEQADDRAAYEAKTAEERAALEAERAAREAERAAREAAEIEARREAMRAAEEAEAARLAAEQARQDSIEAERAKHDSIASEQKHKNGYDRFTIGVRGGAAGLLHTVKAGNWTCGGDAILDLQYAHYWTKDGRPVDLGIIVGLGIGYSQSGMRAAVDTSYTVSTTDGNIDYTLKADEVREHDGQIQLEVPVMFSLIHQNGLFLNVGPKFMLPVYTPYKQNITNPQINAYFPTEGVNVSNEVITGYLKDNQLTNSGTDNGNQFSINVMMTAELGYEWTLKGGNSFGLGAYANYCVYNSFKNSGTVKSLMDVTAPNGSSVATVDVLSATKTYATGLGYFDAGIKLGYHFNFPKKQYQKYSNSKLF